MAAFLCLLLMLCLVVPAASVVWPSSCAGRTGWQSSCTCTATSFTVPADISAIPPNAFAHCRSLTSVSAHPAVVSVGYYAFFYATALESFAWPVGATTVPAYAFQRAYSLREITGLGAVTSVWRYAFAYTALE